MTENKKEYNKKYYQEHKEQHASYQKKYYEAHKKEIYEKYKDRHAEWQRKNKDKVKANKAKYYKKVALHKKRVKQAKFQCRDSKGRFCRWEDKPLDISFTLRSLLGATLAKITSK